jgi:ubiquinone biosynthesis monooxygenase Coq6
MATLTENFNLQRALLCHLNDVPAVRILQGTKVTSIQSDGEQHGSWPLVHLDNQQVLRARLLVCIFLSTGHSQEHRPIFQVGADGFNSPVRSFAQISSYGWPYDAQAIVATMIHRPRGAFEGPNHTAYQRFLPTGPIAFLPLTPTMSSLVWSTKSALASSLLACDPAVLAIMINVAFRLPYLSAKYLHNFILEKQAKGIPISADTLTEEVQWRERSHGIHEHSAYSSLRKAAEKGVPPADSEAVPPLVTELQAGTVASFPLRYSHAESYVGEGSGSRTVLVGDAAHTVHPLAGQGLNLGLGDVECLARCIREAIATGSDMGRSRARFRFYTYVTLFVGSHAVLLPYSQERYLANHILMSSIDKLHKIYGTDNEAVVWARSAGVEALNELDSIKAAIMMFVGADSSKPPSIGSVGWNLAGNAVGTLSTVMKAMKGAVQRVASM